jgi:hypothetical protein
LILISSKRDNVNQSSFILMHVCLCTQGKASNMWLSMTARFISKMNCSSRWSNFQFTLSGYTTAWTAD